MKIYHKKIKVYFLKIRRDEILALGGAEKNLFLNFEQYNLAIRMVDDLKIGELLDTQIIYKILQSILS